MAKPNLPEKQTPPQLPVWGTWEELLLACAVNRHGTASWDSVAAELRQRATAAATFLLLTPLSCKQKFHDLRQRFSKNDTFENDNDNDGVGELPFASIPFLDELRRRRVDELRREVRRYDLSIVSLESKVEKLKEEREQSLRVSDERETKPDLERDNEEEEREENDDALNIENEPPENKVSGEGSLHDERSENESNSSDPAKKESDRSEPVAGGKPPEDSYDGSSDTTAKGSAAEEAEKVESEKLGRVGGESAESKGGLGRVEEEEEEGTKEVCSRESLSSRKKVEPDEPEGEGDERSVETRRAHSEVESQPLIGFLETLRSRKSGSFFERRLEIQETPGYNSMIRQHIDFEMIRIRLEEGWYSGCNIKFFRDLLLIFSNAIIFFGQKAPESKAAAKLRSMVHKEMTAQSIASKAIPIESQESLPKDDEPRDPSSVSLMRKPKISVPLNACRKRSSIASRTVSTTSSSGQERKSNKEQMTSSLLDVKQSERAFESSAAKKGQKDGSRANTRSNNLNKGKKNESSEAKPDKEKNSNSSSGGGSNASGKKRSATDFLNRMKRGSPLGEASKDSDSSWGGADQEPEQKKNSSKKQEPPTPQSRKVSSGGKQVKETPENQAKRNVGRPTKRSAAAAALASPPPGKRSRQSGETEVVSSSSARKAKKRSKK